MGWITALALYFLIWWVVLFAVLPWGVRPPDDPGQGHEHGAPETPDLKKKFWITTGVSAGILVFILLIDWLGFFSFLKDWLKSA